MNIHEYQAKALLKEFGAPVAQGVPIFSEGDVDAAAEQVLDAKVILWAGHCSVHKLFRPEHCDEIAEANETADTPTTILVHPECCKEVVDKADGPADLNVHVGQ